MISDAEAGNPRGRVSALRKRHDRLGENAKQGNHG